MICEVLFCAPFWFLQLLTFPNCTLLAAPEPFLWLAVYRWKCQNHQRPQRSQRFQNFLRHRRESGRERGGGPWWIFVACWPLWRKGLYRFEGLANVSWMWIDSIVLVRVQSFGCPNVVTHMSTQRQRKHEVLAFAFWVVGCSALNKHGSECVRMASWYKLARRISSLRQEYRDCSSGLFLCGPQGFKWHEPDFIRISGFFHGFFMLDDLWWFVHPFDSCNSFHFFLICTLLAALEPSLWLAVYRWKCQNHQRPQRSQRHGNHDGPL